MAGRLLAVCVVACLCLSVGEGLRLTPLPVSPLAGGGREEARLNVAGSSAVSPYKCGPLHMPAQAQAQKRGKRQLPDCACPPSQSVGAPAADPRHDSGARPTAAVVSTLSASEPADRAPPRVV